MAGRASAPPTIWADPTFAAGYDRTFGQQLAPVVAQLLLQLALPQPGEQTLECACGTGALTLPLARALGNDRYLLATDRSPAMLALATGKAAALDGAAIGFLLQDMQALGMAPSQFQLAIANLGLQVVDNRVRALCELRRILRPSGRLAFSVPGDWSLEPFWTYFWRRVAQPDAAPALQSAPRRWTAADVAASLLGDQTEWRSQIEAAGFVYVTLSVERAVAWFPSARDFLATGAFGHIGRARGLIGDEQVRDRVFADVTERLDQRRTPQGVPIDVTVLCPVAYAPAG